MYFCPFNSRVDQRFLYAYYENNVQKYNHIPRKFTRAQVKLMNDIRMLWEQHGVWTRSAIISLALDEPYTDLVINRLLRNPKDFEQALKSFYGNQVAAKFRDLLTSHLVIAAQLVKAAKAGDDKAAAETEKQWYNNADEIAALLGSINPYWSEEDWRIMMHRHLALVKAEAVDMLTKDYEAGIDVYDDIEKQALEMADEMSEGIIKQFSVY